MTKTNMNIARPEGYSAAEKLLSWARMGWQHVGLFAFVLLATMTVSSIGEQLDEYLTSFISDKIENSDDQDYYERYSREFSAYPVMVLFGITGLLVDKVVGRFYGLIIVLFITVLGSALMSLANPGPTGFIILYALTSWYGVQAVNVMASIYCYESVPLKFRLISVLSLTLGQTMGRLVMSLADRSMTEDLEEPAEIWELRGRILVIVPPIFLLLSVAVGFLFNKKDTPLSYVSVRNRAGLAFDQLAQEGTKNTAEPIPMTRDEFETNTSKDLERLGSLRSLRGIVKRSFIGPTVVISSVMLAYAAIQKPFYIYYYWYTSDYLGKGYAKNYIPMMLLEHGTAIGGIVVAMGLWVWIKDIRFLPPAALLFAALGCVVCASVNTVHASGWPLDLEEIESSMTRVTSGVTMMLIGEPLALRLFQVIVLDMFTTENRARGVFGALMLRAFFMGIMGTLVFNFREAHTFLIICATVITAIGASVFAVFYTTQWFDQSLVCRDPELDACWLISSQQANGPVVGSRDKQNRDSSTMAGSISAKFSH